MTASVDFYILEKHNPEQQLLFTCRLLEKAYRLKHQVFVYSDSSQKIRDLNDLLWTFNDISFIPHGLIESDNNHPLSIVLGSETIPGKYCDIVLILNSCILPSITQFQRIMNIVLNQEPFLTEARKHFTYYRNQGCTVNTHKINT